MAFKHNESFGPPQVYNSGLTGRALVGLFILFPIPCYLLLIFAGGNDSFVPCFSWFLTIVSIMFAAGFIYPALAHWGERVELDTNGITIKRRSGTKTMLWSEIRDVRKNQRTVNVNGAPVIQIHEYTLDCIDGSSVTIGNTFPRIGELGATIQMKVEQAKNAKAR